MRKFAILCLFLMLGFSISNCLGESKDKGGPRFAVEQIAANTQTEGPLLFAAEFSNPGEKPLGLTYVIPDAFVIELRKKKREVITNIGVLPVLKSESIRFRKSISIKASGSVKEPIICSHIIQNREFLEALRDKKDESICEFRVVFAPQNGPKIESEWRPLSTAYDSATGAKWNFVKESASNAQDVALALMNLPPLPSSQSETHFYLQDVKVKEQVQRFAQEKGETGYLAQSVLVRSYFGELLSYCEKNRIVGEDVKKLDLYKQLVEADDKITTDYLTLIRRERALYMSHIKLLTKDTKNYENAVRGMAGDDDDWIAQRAKAHFQAWKSQKKGLGEE